MVGGSGPVGRLCVGLVACVGLVVGLCGGVPGAQAAGVAVPAAKVVKSTLSLSGG